MIAKKKRIKKTKKQTESFFDTMKKFRRGPQIVTPKDAAQIIAAVGLRPDWRCADLGGGSGFLALFVANLVPKGRVYVYEKREDFCKIVKDNVKKSGLKNVTVKNKPASQLREKNLDLITMDMKGAEDVVSSCAAALRSSGFLCIYSPHIEQQKAVVSAMSESKLRHITTIENIQRKWQVSKWTHPVPSQVVHTGFITIARKG